MCGNLMGTLQTPRCTSHAFPVEMLTNCSRSYTDQQALKKEPNSKQAFVRVSEVDRTFSNPAVGQPLHRFYFRSTVGVLGPIVVSAFFIVIWRIYLVPSNAHGPLAFGPPGAIYVFYSWFIAGVVGLNLSLYGLAGVEAAMLMEPAWNVGDAMRLMMHADRTWSGPGGWLKMLNWIAEKPTFGAQRKFPGHLWFVLAIPSILIFIAWPLSGLCLETTQGFLHGKPVAGSNVTGFAYANFNERLGPDVFIEAAITWKNALDARIPGQGIVYTQEQLDRSQHAFLTKVPNTLPKNAGIPRIFMTAQAERPIEGKAWGLLFQYDCSIVDELSEMTILKDRRSASDNSILNATSGMKSYYLQNSTSRVIVQNQTDPLRGLWASNIHVVVETAYQVWPNKSVTDLLFGASPQAVSTEITNCYFNKNSSIYGDYPNIDQERVFEMLLWQKVYNTSYGTGPAPQYNLSIDRNITELYGAYDYRDFAYDIPKNKTASYPRQPMTAIGVQCRSSSSVGTADINGVRSTYSNFQRTDTPINVQRNRCANRFGAETAASMVPGHTDPGTINDEWLSSLFTSTAAPPPFYAPYTDNSNDVDAGTGYLLQLSYLQASQLCQSILRAYAAYATQLMYNGGQGFTALDGSHVAFLNPNVTSFVPGTVIKQGVLSAELPLALFCLWTLMSTSLCIMYGFRRRWSAILDGHTLFRLGVGLKASHRQAIQETSSAADVEECHILNNVPGLVGDVEPDSAVGRIGLVMDSAADRRRLYT